MSHTTREPSHSKNKAKTCPNPNNLILRWARVRTTRSLFWACMPTAHSLATPTSATLGVVPEPGGQVLGYNFLMRTRPENTWNSSSCK